MKKAFSIVEVLVATALVGVLAVALSSLMSTSLKQQTQSNTTAAGDLIRRNFLAQLTNEAAWTNTVAHASNTGTAATPKMECLRNHTPCTVDGTPGGAPITNQAFVLIDPRNTLFYDPSAGSGFTTTNEACTGFNASTGLGNDACPLGYKLSWSANCAAGACADPQVKLNVEALYNPKSPTKNVAFNTANYGVKDFLRPSSGGATAAAGVGATMCTNNSVSPICLAAASGSGTGTANARAISCRNNPMGTGNVGLQLGYSGAAPAGFWFYYDNSSVPTPCIDGTTLILSW